jgi:hypothetical protein
MTAETCKHMLSPQLAVLVGLSCLQDEDRAAAPVQEKPAQEQHQSTAADQATQQGNELSTAAAKLVAEVVASPIFYLVAGVL